MKAYSKKNPHKKWRDCLKEAKKTYKKQEDRKARLSLAGKKKTSGKRYRSSGSNDCTCLEHIDDSFLNKKELQDITTMYEQVETTRKNVLKRQTVLMNEQKRQQEKEEATRKQQNTEEVETEKNAVLKEAEKERGNRNTIYNINDQVAMKDVFKGFLASFLPNFKSYFDTKYQSNTGYTDNSGQIVHAHRRELQIDEQSINKFEEILNYAISHINPNTSIENTAYMLFRDILGLDELVIITSNNEVFPKKYNTPPYNAKDRYFRLTQNDNMNMYQYDFTSNLVPDVALMIGGYCYSIKMLIQEIDGLMINKTFDFDENDFFGPYASSPTPLHSKYNTDQNKAYRMASKTNENLLYFRKILNQGGQTLPAFANLVNKLDLAVNDFNMQKKLKTNKKGRAYETCTTTLPDTLLNDDYTRTIIEKVEKVAHFNLTRIPRTLVLFQNQRDAYAYAYLAWFDPSVNIEPMPNKRTETKIGIYCKGVIQITKEDAQSILQIMQINSRIVNKTKTVTAVDNKTGSFTFNFSKANIKTQ